MHQDINYYKCANSILVLFLLDETDPEIEILLNLNFVTQVVLHNHLFFTICKYQIGNVTMLLHTNIKVHLEQSYRYYLTVVSSKMAKPIIIMLVMIRAQSTDQECAIEAANHVCANFHEKCG